LAKATLEFDHRIRSVAVRTGPTSGKRRIPQYRLIGGDANTVTNHVERGITFRLNPLQVTFSGGNKLERVSIADQVKPEETVVDMFACVGQFALHIAKKRTVSVVAIEINPIAHAFLVENIALNNFENVTPVLGDCRVVHPKSCADRVIMGYLHNTVDYLPHAFETLRPEGGIIHMHISIPPQEIREITEQIREQAIANGYDVIVDWRRIKTYSPGVVHYLFEINAK
jgi:tRNA wybutosine-synthesizing protein 2